jgi:hypothetical protein
MPSIMESVRVDPDFSHINITDVAGHGQENKTDFTIATKALEEKTVACSLLVSFINDLGDAFSPYFLETVTIMLPLMHYEFSDEVKDYAIGSLSDLVKCGVEAVASGKLEAKIVRG